jgi:hypothetical protein
LQKAGFEYKEKDKKHLSEEKYYYDDWSSSGVWGVSLFDTLLLEDTGG